MSNLLLNRTFTEKVQDQVVQKNPSLWRGVFIELITLISSLSLGYFYRLFITNQPIAYLGLVPGFWTIITTLSIFFIASLFHAVLIKDFGRRTAVQVAEMLCLGFFLYNESLSWLITEGFALLLVMSGSWRARSELNNSLNIRFFRIAGLYYGRLVMALALMATIFYFPYWQMHKTIVSEPVFNGMTSWSLGLVSSFYPDMHLTPSSTFDDIVTSLSQQEIQKIPGAEKLPESEQVKIKDQASVTISEQLKSKLGGVSPEPEESISHFIYRLIEHFIQQLEDQLGQWFFFGWAVIILFISFSFGRVYSLIMSGIAFIIYQIILASRFVNVYTETVSKESIDF